MADAAPLRDWSAPPDPFPVQVVIGLADDDDKSSVRFGGELYHWTGKVRDYTEAQRRADASARAAWRTLRTLTGAGPAAMPAGTACELQVLAGQDVHGRNEVRPAMARLFHAPPVIHLTRAEVHDAGRAALAAVAARAVLGPCHQVALLYAQETRIEAYDAGTCRAYAAGEDLDALTAALNAAAMLYEHEWTEVLHGSALDVPQSATLRAAFAQELKEQAQNNVLIAAAFLETVGLSDEASAFVAAYG